MPNRVQWNPGYGVGNETLDNQHKNMLIQCNALADCIDDSTDQSDLKFHDIFNALMTQAREHFSTEETLLIRCGYPSPEEHRDEHDEFEYLVADIMTTENFEKIEIQNFLVLWWIGHIVGSGKKYRAFLEKLPSA